eukprot:709245-Lingulodinium_polyedra.AAC.1
MAKCRRTGPAAEAWPLPQSAAKRRATAATGLRPAQCGPRQPEHSKAARSYAGVASQLAEPAALVPAPVPSALEVPHLVEEP